MNNLEYGASYILEDGTIFKVKDLGYKTHCDYETYLIDNGLLERYEPHCRHLTNLNHWVRINDGKNYSCEVLAELPIKEITEEQYKSLFKFIDYLRINNKSFIEIGCEEHSRGVHFTDKSLWYHKFDLTKFTNKEIEFFIRDAYRTFSMYQENN